MLNPTTMTMRLESAMTLTIKSVHIKECWPFEYVAPIRDGKKKKVISQFSKDKANARKRELYHQKKRLMELKVFELDIDICHELNKGSRNEPQSSK